MPRNILRVSIIFNLLCCCILSAAGIENSPVDKKQKPKEECPCGCNCGAGCWCGCEFTGSCNCKPDDASTKDDEEEIDVEEVKKEGCHPWECGCSKQSKEIRQDVRNRGCTFGRCCHQYPKRCNHDACARRYWCQAHSVYLGPYDCLDGDCSCAFGCGYYGVWLPEDGLLFKPFVADPRQVTYSVGWRFNDQALTKNVIPVSFGDNLAMYRWCSVWPFGGQLQINIEGALWGVFDPLDESSPLLNADYYVGIPVSYAIGRWGWRIRFYHISSHIGDEFLIFHPGFDRRNPSAEYLDSHISYYITDEIRFYGGAGWIIQHDDSFASGNWYLEAGAELRLLGLGFYNSCQNLFGHPFMGMHFHFNNHYSRHIDNTYVVGYEWGKSCGNQRRVRAFLEYHDGYSVDGQFRKHACNYLSIRISYGY